MTNYRIFTFAQRPDLEEPLESFWQYWEPFMLEDPISNQHWSKLRGYFPEFQLMLCDEQDQVIAKGNSLPFVWDENDATLDERGWDWVFENGVLAYEAGQKPTAVSAIEINIRPPQRGSGLSTLMVQAMRDNARRLGFSTLVAPVRPSLKAKYPLTSIEDYMRWTHDASGAPFDPWLRVHWKQGARIVKAAPRSMVIQGTVTAWEGWTKLRFPQSGPYVVAGALSPITIDREQDRGEYIEPNVWMRHSLSK
jgi:hypothetical protein